jgi:hypothetical protein
MPVEKLQTVEWLMMESTLERGDAVKDFDGLDSAAWERRDHASAAFRDS